MGILIKCEYDGSKKYLRDSILNDEWKLMIESAKQRKSTEFVAHIASDLSWLHLWDTMLEQGSEGTAILQALYQIATWPHVEALSICPGCKESTDTQSVFLHHITHHLRKSKHDIEEVLRTGIGKDFIQARKFQFCSSPIT